MPTKSKIPNPFSRKQSRNEEPNVHSSISLPKYEEIGTKYTFMAEQLFEAKICQKDLLVFHDKASQDQIFLLKNSLKITDDSLADTRRSSSFMTKKMIAKVFLKMQYIRDEEMLLSDMVEEVNQKLAEVEYAVESLNAMEFVNPQEDSLVDFANQHRHITQSGSSHSKTSGNAIITGGHFSIHSAKSKRKNGTPASYEPENELPKNA